MLKSTSFNNSFQKFFHGWFSCVDSLKFFADMGGDEVTTVPLTIHPMQTYLNSMERSHRILSPSGSWDQQRDDRQKRDPHHLPSV